LLGTIGESLLEVEADPRRRHVAPLVEADLADNEVQRGPGELGAVWIRQFEHKSP
jgi:hypothetical protein